MFSGERIPTTLYHCEHCGFAFYDLRFSNDQIAKLYEGYRGEAYQKIRQQSDVWYTKEINRLLDVDNSATEARKDTLINLIERHCDTTEPFTMLDFGGDRGQSFPYIKGARNFVYDISNKPLVEGAIGLKSIDEAKNIDFSLIMCNHVLEHVNEPIATAKSIVDIMGDKTLLYIELPMDSPFYASKFDNLKFLTNKYFTWGNILKHFVITKFDNCFAPMSEHINYFTLKSMSKLVDSLGLKVIESGEKTINCGWNNTKAIYCLCAKPQRSNEGADLEPCC